MKENISFIITLVTLVILFIVSSVLTGCIEIEESQAQDTSYKTSVAIEGQSLTIEWQTIREWECPENGIYLILYNVKAINNEHDNVAFSLEMRCGRELLEYAGENITDKGHYKNHNLSWIGKLFVGEIIYINAKAANSMKGLREKSVVIPYEIPGNHRKHESLSIVEITGYWYQSDGFLPFD